MVKALDRSARRELISQAAARLRRREGAQRRWSHALSHSACPICGTGDAADAGAGRLHAHDLAAPVRRAVRPESAAPGRVRS